MGVNIIRCKVMRYRVFSGWNIYYGNVVDDDV